MSFFSIGTRKVSRMLLNQPALQRTRRFQLLIFAVSVDWNHTASVLKGRGTSACGWSTLSRWLTSLLLLDEEKRVRGGLSSEPPAIRIIASAENWAELFHRLHRDRYIATTTWSESDQSIGYIITITSAGVPSALYALNIWRYYGIDCSKISPNNPHSRIYLTARGLSLLDILSVRSPISCSSTRYISSQNRVVSQFKRIKISNSFSVSS